MIKKAIWIVLAASALAAAYALVPKDTNPQPGSFHWDGFDPMESGQARYAIVTLTDEGCRNLFGRSLQKLLDQKRGEFEPQMPVVLANLARKRGVWIEALGEMKYIPRAKSLMTRNTRPPPEDEGWEYRVTRLDAEALTGWMRWRSEGQSGLTPQPGCRYDFATEKISAAAHPDNLGTSGMSISGVMTPPSAVPLGNSPPREPRGGYLTLTHSAGTATVALAAIYRDSETLLPWNAAMMKRLEFESEPSDEEAVSKSQASASTVR